MQFNCPHCQYLLKVPDNAAGRTGTCPSCHNKVRVPSNEPSEPTTIPCPFCAEMISPKAIKCRFCGEYLDSRNGGSRGNVDDRESNHRPRHSTARHGAVSSSPNNGAANGWDNGAERESGHRVRHRTARHGSIPSASSNSYNPGVTEFGGLFGMSWRSLGIIAVIVVILGAWVLQGGGETQKSKKRTEREDISAGDKQTPESNDYMANLRRRAERGDAEAQFELAEVYLKADDPKGLEWFRKAAESGHIKAQMVLGRVAEDPAEALKWCYKALAQGTLAEKGEKLMVETILRIQKNMTEDEMARTFKRLLDNGELSRDEMDKVIRIAEKSH